MWKGNVNTKRSEAGSALLSKMVKHHRAEPMASVTITVVAASTQQERLADLEKKLKESEANNART